MAFKNLLRPNVSVAGRFTKNLTYIVNYNGGLTTYETNPYNGLYCVKIVTDGTKREGVYLNSIVYTIGLPYSFNLDIYCNNATTFTLFIGGTLNRSISVQAGYNNLKFENATITTTTNGAYLATDQARTFYYLRGQVEQNDHSTPWEFPGVDLTGNSIPSNTVINNVKLENIIHAFGITSTEQVNNLTLENILTLTNISSEEYVNNIELLNEIILEGIESTTSIHDLIIYILNEIAVYHVNIQRKQEYNTVLNTKQTYEVKV